jgi:hypothetical protein
MGNSVKQSLHSSTDKWNDELKGVWAQITFPAGDIQEIIGFYEKFSRDLLAVHDLQQRFYNSRNRIGMFPQLCDLEAEITYLRIRAYRPQTIIEISPASGWSTSWILNALKDNGSGVLHSYDLVSDSTRTIPAELAKDRWKFYEGDIRNNMNLLPATAEYLFIDSDHSAEFADWYLTHLFPLFPKGTRVSVHDIMKWSNEPGWGEESLVLCEWLADRKINCATVCRILKDKGYSEVLSVRNRLGFHSMIQSANYNSMIYFNL